MTKKGFFKEVTKIQTFMRYADKSRHQPLFIIDAIKVVKYRQIFTVTIKITEHIHWTCLRQELRIANDAIDYSKVNVIHIYINEMIKRFESKVKELKILQNEV